MFQCVRWCSAWGRRLQPSSSLFHPEMGLTWLTDLFDRDHYLSQLDPGLLNGMPPLEHYVLFGDPLGLSPSPLFDVRHYDSVAGPRHGVNRLLHYALVAHFNGTSPSPWFDPEYYLRANPDVGSLAVEAVRHFQSWGWREGRNPRPGLDIRRVLESKSRLRLVKGNPLSLFGSEWIASQARGGDRSLPSTNPSSADAINMLDPSVWSDLELRQWDGPVTVDVLMPVVAGVQQSLRSLHSVLVARVRTAHRVVVITDNRSDSELNVLLRNLAARNLITLEQKSHLSLIRSINHGLRLDADADVVVLCTDTEVYNDWLDRLAHHAQQTPRLASVTPLSSHAGVFSYPEPQGENHHTLEVPPNELDGMAAEVNRRAWVPTPAGHSSCLWLRREAIRDVGLPDDRRQWLVSQSLGEFFHRLTRHGWGHAVACDVYVRRSGGSEHRSLPAELEVPIAPRHAALDAELSRFALDDPLWHARVRIDLARLRRFCGPRNLLLVCHNRGGGTERNLLERAQQLRTEGWSVFELRPLQNSAQVVLRHPGVFGLHNLATLRLADAQMLSEALETLRIGEIEIHHLVDFPPHSARALTEQAQRLDIRLKVVVHDYFWMCPRINLVTTEGRFCGQPTEASCNHCLSRDDLIDRVGDIRGWRQESAKLLAAARQVVVPSDDAARRLGQVFPGPVFAVRPHLAPPPPGPLVMRQAKPGEKVRVLVIGAIGRIKGFDALRGLARVLAQQGLPITLSLLGYSMDDGQLAAAGVQLLGRYFDHELPQRIQDCDPHLILIPSIWPETYCYVLSSALESGRRVAAFDLGAQAERCRAHDPRHLLLPLELAHQPELLAQRLAEALFVPTSRPLAAGVSEGQQGAPRR